MTMAERVYNDGRSMPVHFLCRHGQSRLLAISVRAALRAASMGRVV